MPAALIALLAVLSALFLGCMMGTVVGAVAGFIVGLLFDDSLALLAQVLGIQAAPYQLGAIFGFVGGFFRTTVSGK